MPVLRLREEPRCKICQSAYRDAIDAYLEMRSKREKDAAGETVNEDYIKRAMSSYGIENPTRENIVVHWRKHCQVVDTATAENLMSSEIDELVKEHLGDDWGARLIRVAEFLPLMLTYLSRDIIQKMRAGQPLGPLVEQYQKLAAESGRRKSDEAVDNLMEELAMASAVDTQPSPEEMEEWSDDEA